MPTVSAHVALTLSQHVDSVFGIMGNGNAYFLDAIEKQTTTRYTAVRHEQGSVAAADAYFRASGKLAAATTTYGAGFTNTLTALAEAVQARTPLVLVVGDEPTSGPRPWDVDQIALASGVGARTYTVGRTDAAATTVIAIEHALTYAVPVVLAIPYDVATVDVGDVPDALPPRPAEMVLPRGEFAEAMIDTIASALIGAQRPVLLAGRGAWLAKAGAALGRLAALSGALTATTALGRGLFPDSSRDIGVTGGFGAQGAMDLIAEADVVVVFGAGLNQFTMRFGSLVSPATQLFQVDVTSAATHAHVTGFVRADARFVAEALAMRLAALPPRMPWRSPETVAEARTYSPGDALASDGRLDPRSAAMALADYLPQERVVVSDGGHFMGWPNMYWPVSSPDRIIMVGTAFQSIGLGWPSLVGATLARPDSTIVLASGDGGGLMAIADLESAVRTASGRGCAVIFNDAAYGAEVNLYGLRGLAREPMLIPEVSFAALGEALGAEGVVVRELSDLERVASWARESPRERRFLVVDLRISGAIIAPHQHEVIHANASLG